MDLDMGFIEAGAVMALGVFIFALVFFVISAPMDSMLDSFDDIDSGNANAAMDRHMPNIRLGWKMGMALIVTTPIVGFIVWVYSREPDWKYYRRY